MSLEPRNVVLMIASWLLVAMSIVYAIVAPLVVGVFEEVFSSFGADLPLMTMLFLKWRYLGWLLPVAALVPALIMSRKKEYAIGYQTKIAVGLVTLFSLSVVLVIIGIVAMYSPIFALGQTV